VNKLEADQLLVVINQVIFFLPLDYSSSACHAMQVAPQSCVCHAFDFPPMDNHTASFISHAQ
jgi:hypothetical protein